MHCRSLVLLFSVFLFGLPAYSESPYDEPDKTQDVSLGLELVGFSCVRGFTGWLEPPKDAAGELACDEENLRHFKIVLGRCSEKDPLSVVAHYDSDKDGCATCKDYVLWKKTLLDLAQAGKRTGDGQKLFLQECDQSEEAGREQR